MLLKINSYEESVNYYVKAAEEIARIEGNSAACEFLSNITEKMIDSPFSILLLKKIVHLAQIYGENSEKISIYLNSLAHGLIGNNQFEEALTYAEKALSINKQLDNELFLLSSYLNLCKIYISLNDIEKTKSYIDLSVSILKAHPNKEAESELNYLRFLYFSHLEEDFEAEKYLKLHIEAFSDTNDYNAEFLSLRYSELGDLYQKYSKLEKALSCFTKAFEIYEKHYGKESIGSGSYLDQIGSILCLQKNYEKSLEYLFDSLDIKLKLVSNNDQSLISTYYQIALTYSDMKEYSLALEYVEIIIPLIKKFFGEKSMELGAVYKFIGEIYENLMNRKQAKAFYILAREICAEKEFDEDLEYFNSKLSDLDI